MPERAHRVELVESELIRGRGTRKVSWRVQRADGWIAVSDWPGAVRQQLEPGPGTIWETRIELELPTGTRLERIESSPAPPERRDPLEYLSRETRSTKRQVRRTPYRVSARGEVVAVQGA